MSGKSRAPAGAARNGGFLRHVLCSCLTGVRVESATAVWRSPDRGLGVVARGVTFRRGITREREPDTNGVVWLWEWRLCGRSLRRQRSFP